MPAKKRITSAMTPRDNDSIHGMSMLVGELVAKVEHLNSNVRMNAQAAESQRDKLHEKFDELRDVIFGVKNDVQTIGGNVEVVQQDVAEMKHDMVTTKSTLEDYQRNKVVIMGDVDKLKEVVEGFRLQEQRALGWWDAAWVFIKVWWKIIAAIIVAGFTIFYTYILPKWM